MPTWRAANACVIALLLLVSGAAVVDSVLFGVTSLTPWLLGGMVWFSLTMLLSAYLATRLRAQALEASTSGLQNLAERLEDSLASLSAVNAQLHRSESRYKGLVDAQGDAILRRSPNGQLTYGNDAFFRVFGLDRERAIGTPFAPITDPDGRSPEFGNLTAQEKTGSRVAYDQKVRTAYGWRWIAWEDFAICDPDGRLIEIQSVGRDITERKALEDALTAARDRAESANRAKSGYLATISHEIRTPMNGVLGMARLLLETGMSPEQRTYAEAIRHSGASLLSLIEQILDFSKIESGAIDLEQEEVDIRANLDAVVELLAPRAHERNIEIIGVVSPETPEIVRCDGLRLRQIITNLVGNAIKFTDRGGVRIDVHGAECKGRAAVHFKVQDTGVGIAADRREEIFKEFVQGDPAHARKSGGSGLGLAISRRLVEAMEGEIGVDSEPGVGSSFWFTIPAPVVRHASRDKALTDSRVAIVTRNAVLRDGLAALVQEAGGEVVPFPLYTDGKPPLATPDAVLIDAGTASRPDLPVEPVRETACLVLLTPGARSWLDALAELGFSGYLVKPVRFRSLVARVKGQSGTAGEVLSIEDFSAEHTRHGDRLGPVRTLNVLLAEDNDVNALLTRELLERRGHAVRRVKSGEAAIAALRGEPFDLLLTDLHMPGLDGIDTARSVRGGGHGPANRSIPIVALTADTLDAARQACQDAGMDGFLTKPIVPAELDAMVTRLFSDKLCVAAE